MEIDEQCRSQGFFLHPEAKEKLEKINRKKEVVEEVIASIPSKETVIKPTHIQKVLKELRKSEKKEKIQKKKPNSLSLDFEVERDITEKSCCRGNLGDFVDYFNNRFDKLSKELRKRNGISQTRPIESLSNFSGDVSVIGLVNNKRTTSNGHTLIEVEDKSGDLPTLVLKNNTELQKKAQKILVDEVIGLKGRISDESDLLIIEDIVWPDKPFRNEPNCSSHDIYAVFISDIHFGSKSFLQESWDRFIKWINGEATEPRQRKLIKKIKYLVIAGDLVEGVGVYPNQKEVLSIQSIGEQYKKAADELSRIRDDIEMILSPGNHDAVRQAEPQPALNEEIREYFKDNNNITFVGNPALIRLNNVRTLIYHGRSLDDMVADLPDRKYEEPGKLMKEYVKRRHLVPSYGKKTPVATEKTDHLLVDDPDIIHSGHIHKLGIEKYRGTTLLNTGTWQGQTKFQKKKGIEPTPGRAVLYNLKNHSPKILRFHD